MTPKNKTEEPSLYLRIRMNKTTFCLDMPANKSILDIKTEIATICPDYKSENIRLFQNTKDQLIAFLEENKILKNYNITEDNAQAHKPFEMLMSIRDNEEEDFEEPQVENYVADDEVQENASDE